MYLAPRVVNVIFNDKHDDVASLQVRNDSKKYSGYKIVVVLVGANNIGNTNIEDVVEDLREFLIFLQDNNPGASIYACEVGIWPGLLIFYDFTINFISL